MEIKREIEGGIQMKFGKKIVGLAAATIALGIGTTQVFAASSWITDTASNVTFQYIPTANGSYYVMIPASALNGLTTTTPAVSTSIATPQVASTPVTTPTPTVSAPVATPTPAVSAPVTTPAPAVSAPVTTPAPAVSTPQGATISIERAKQIAQAKAPGATLWEIHPDYEHGRLVYEVELRNGYIEYSMDIDATTGAIYDYEVDYDD